MPTYRPANSGLQTKGTLWGGFDPTISSTVAGVFLVSVMLTFGAIAVLKISWVIAAPAFFLLPNALLFAVIFLLVLGKPPRHLLDWCDSRVLGRSEVDASRLVHPEFPVLDE